MYAAKNKRISKTRKHRKRQFIRRKNSIRDPAFWFGNFYCEHSFGPESRATWVDFTFASERQKNRYFSVKMRTVETAIKERLEREVADALDKTMPYPESGFWLEKAGRHPHYGQLYSLGISEAYQKVDRERSVQEKALLAQLTSQTQVARPEIIIKKSSTTFITVLTIVNKSFIDIDVIQDFIAHFRKLGEPSSPGVAWRGAEIRLVLEHSIAPE